MRKQGSGWGRAGRRVTHLRPRVAARRGKASVCPAPACRPAGSPPQGRRVELVLGPGGDSNLPLPLPLGSAGLRIKVSVVP